tara:strand:- start:1841 stop:2878 length:1038 start_codon:yes stop_codon:yes gene_type:complete
MNEYKEYNNMGLTGLTNLGNTCFMNSVLQCLSHTYELNDFLSTEEYKKKLNRVPDSLILWEWDKLRKQMWSENCIISPGGFLHSIQRIARIKDAELFTGYLQNDLTEFLDFLINCFHTSIKREVKMTITGEQSTTQDEMAVKCYEMMKVMYKKEYSEMIDLFFGIHVSKVTSLESNYENISPEPFFNLLLELPKAKNISLYDCLDTYTKQETIESGVEVDDNKKKEKADKQILFWSLPKILVITLKRFNNNNMKDKRLVNFDDELDLRKYVVGYAKGSYKYDLYGVCNHMGGTRGGHYTSYIKNANGKWYLCNDTNVNEVANLNKIKSPAAYCFFYRKKKHLNNI